jgi:formylglycine-generating enzyme required for sulfatase activity
MATPAAAIPTAPSSPAVIAKTRRGLNRNIVVLGSVTLLLLGGLGFFLASRGGNISNSEQRISKQIINNSYFQSLVASGATTKGDLEAFAMIRPYQDGFIGISGETMSWARASELAAKTGSRILSVDEVADGSREPLLAWLESTFRSHLPSSIWVRERLEARVLDGGEVLVVTALDRKRPAFFHWAASAGPLASADFALIPAGEFQMGQNGIATPVHAVNVSAFYMGKYEVTKEEWDAVRAWGLANGYSDLPAGGGKAANHPVHSINWYDMVKWCNARSQKEGLSPCYTVSGAVYKTGQSAPDCNWSTNGYRLPTEAEWEKAARGGMSGKLFPWSTDTITHSQANYSSSSSYAYDVSQTRGNHPTYAVGGEPYSSPVGSFSPNGYGLYDMAGNMWEWCWDWWGSYAADAQTDPRGPASGSYRVFRGGGWYSLADYGRCAYRNYSDPPYAYDSYGFRLARGQP